MGLRRIVLRDFVIVDELDLDFSTGFSVLTGETGAGKSILIDALQLVTGARSDAATVREGALRAEVSAEFDCPAQARIWLEAAGLQDARADEALLMRRTVDLQGKSRGWINGSPATATQMREIGEQLIDIHGQHAWQSLTRPEAVRGLLDAYAKVDTAALAALWQQWRSAAKTLADAQGMQGSLQRERERLEWQIGELDKLSPRAGEWEEITTDHGRLSNAQSLLDAAQEALDLLDLGETGRAGAAAAVSQAAHRLSQQQHLEPGFAQMTEVLESSLAQMQDTVHSLRAYLRKTELDPHRLEQLDQRMAMWMSLARRYKCAPAELPKLVTAWAGELARLDAAADLAALDAAEKAAQSAYLGQARAASRARAKAAPQLAGTITQTMQGLGMQGGRFEVALTKNTQAQQCGLEEVGFLVAGHSGSAPRQVSKVASGGELSRLALAIAVTTSRLGTAQTLIFDEVDAGVGGAVAQTVGRLMKQLGGDRQVLAVTHLPQVASCADHHLLVSKRLRGNATLSAVTAVQGESRVAEIARMLGGEQLLTTTLAHAKEMLRSGQ